MVQGIFLQKISRQKSEADKKLSLRTRHSRDNPADASRACRSRLRDWWPANKLDIECQPRALICKEEAFVAFDFKWTNSALAKLSDGEFQDHLKNMPLTDRHLELTSSPLSVNYAHCDWREIIFKWTISTNVTKKLTFKTNTKPI